jgi:rRNA maturation protein Nop10
MEKQPSVVSVLTTVVWSARPPLTHLLLIPLLRLTLMMMKKKRKTKKNMMMSEASRRPSPHLFVLNDKGGKYRLKLKSSTQFVLISVLSEKSRIVWYCDSSVICII